MKGFALICTLGMASAAQADFDAASYPPYETCALCHGLFGQSHLDKFPHLAGQKPGYIRSQLDAFLDGHRTNDGGQMSAIVTELKPEDLPVVVAWFSEQDVPLPTGSPLDSLGITLTQDYGCLECHDGDAGNDVPHLTAQHAGYLAKQMHDFRDDKRTHSDVAQMHQTLFVEMKSGIESIASYLASLERNK